MRPSTQFFICLLLITCKGKDDPIGSRSNNFNGQLTKFETINAIPPPDGYERIALSQNSFGEWLRAIRLKKDDRVYLYDGSLKKNQSAQFAVLDKPVGKKNLQQCADAVMRLRAEYLFEQGRYEEIVFRDNNGTPYAWKGKNSQQSFDSYLETVFGMCGTASLEKQLKPVSDWREIQPGDVFVKGGFPGHAMIVVDVAIDKKGKRVFMLAQSYMPAQDIHIVKNPLDEDISPWYEVEANTILVTPEWRFLTGQLYKW